MHKTIALSDAVEKIPDGASVMIGGFLGVGSPHRIIAELVRQGRKSLTVIANDTARPGVGIGLVIAAKAVRKVVVSHIGTNPETQRQVIASELEAELCPQGTLAERIRAAGCGLGGVLTATGVGTTVAEGQRTVEVDGHDFLIEPPLKAKFALIAAKRCDYRGNLDYALTARIVAMTHAVNGKSKVVKQYTLPLTSIRPVNLVITELAVIEPSDQGLVLKERAPGVTSKKSLAHHSTKSTGDGHQPPQVREMAISA